MKKEIPRTRAINRQIKQTDAIPSAEAPSAANRQFERTGMISLMEAAQSPATLPHRQDDARRADVCQISQPPRKRARISRERSAHVRTENPSMTIAIPFSWAKYQRELAKLMQDLIAKGREARKKEAQRDARNKEALASAERETGQLVEAELREQAGARSVRNHWEIILGKDCIY